MLCYYKKKQEKEFRVKDPNKKSAKGMPVANLTQTVPESSMAVDTDPNARE